MKKREINGTQGDRSIIKGSRMESDYLTKPNIRSLQNLVEAKGNQQSEKTAQGLLLHNTMFKNLLKDFF